jgi:Zn-dependent peptidase ImmA (M78 family)
MSRNKERKEKILRTIANEGITLHYSNLELKNEWQGLYIRSQELGAGICIREGLTESMEIWVISHELGHHRTTDQMQIFSPFEYGRSINKRSNPEEEAANRYALNFLTEPSDWAEAETKFPCSLKQITEYLELPLQAGVFWGREERKKVTAEKKCRFELSGSTWDNITERSIMGSGGAQHTLRKLIKFRINNSTEISRTDYLMIQERAVIMRGGWAGIFKKIASELNKQSVKWEKN